LAVLPQHQGYINSATLRPWFLCPLYRLCNGFLFFFFFFSVMVSCPPHLSRLLGLASAVGFSGSRRFSPPAGVWASVVSAVPAGLPVFVGCAGGADQAARLAFPSASVLSASSFGSGRSSFALRSVAVVRAVASSRRGVWVSFPACACPAGLVPSPVVSSCFCGSGSGSWASLAFARGLGVPCFVWLPPLFAPPAGWGFLSLGGGWWCSC